MIDVAYGHADKLASQPSGSRQPSVSREQSLIDPDWFDTPEMRHILDARDISALYRELKGYGLSHRQIAALTGQSQSEVSEILKGRQVRDVTVLERIADGLGIPRGYLRLASAEREQSAYAECEGGVEAEQEVDEEMRRRALIGSTALAVLGKVVQGIGERAELALPRGGDDPLPKRVTMKHVQAIKEVTHRLRSLARQFGGQAWLFAAAADYYTRWLAAPATEEVQARLQCALADLHTEAGWSGYDSGVDASGHFVRALELADQAGDGYGIANAAFHVGRTLVRRGHPDDALKAFQLGQGVLMGFQPGKVKPATLRPDDPRLPTLIARLHRSSGSAYALMGSPDQAQRCVAKAHDGWEPRDAYDRGVMDHATACVQLDLCRLDRAYQFAASAVRVLGGGPGRMRTSAELMLAEVQVRAGEPRGLSLAQQAIEAVSTLQSVAVQRERLDPLIAALEARPSTDARDLARAARKITASEPPTPTEPPTTT